jgi:hypothetical protein
MFKYVNYPQKVSIFLNAHFSLMSPDPSFKTTVYNLKLATSPLNPVATGLRTIQFLLSLGHMDYCVNFQMANSEFTLEIQFNMDIAWMRDTFQCPPCACVIICLLIKSEIRDDTLPRVMKIPLPKFKINNPLRLIQMLPIFYVGAFTICLISFLFEFVFLGSREVLGKPRKIVF